MKKAILAAVLLISLNSFAQADTTKPKEVYVFDHTDTLKIDAIVYKGENNVVKWASPGYRVYKGKAKQEGKGLVWVVEPKLIGVLDDKKKAVRPL